MKALLEKIKKELNPDLKVLKEIDGAVKRINNKLTEGKIKAVCVKGGSTAKGTFLRGDYDVDLFVRFDYSLKAENLSNILESVLKKTFRKVARVHGSRDYFQIKNKLTFEIVPVLKISSYEKAENVTDMSPLHVDYVKKHINKELADEIRLAKQFCKACNVYGAESHIKGFSGHVLDLLITHYGSFTNLLKNASNWKPKVVMDIEKKLKDPLKELDKAKTHSPLIIVDPIQPCRNAAAALSKEKFDIFKEKSKEFLKNPNEEFFRIKKIDLKEIKRKAGKEELIILDVKTLKGKEDIIGSKLLKAYNYIKKNIKKNDFKILDSNWEFTMFYFIIKKETLPDEVVLRGPPLREKEGVKRFKAKHKETFEENNRMFAKEKRKYKKIQLLIKDIIKEKYVKERTKKITIS